MSPVLSLHSKFPQGTQPSRLLCIPGREEYQILNIQSTFLFPLLAASVLSVGIGRVSEAAGFGHAWNLFPFIIVGVATIENLCIAFLLSQYPEVSEFVAVASGLAASFKWRLLMYSAFSCVLGVGWILTRRMRRGLNL